MGERSASGHKLLETVREHASHAFVGGLFLIVTGFTPEHWVDKFLQTVHLSHEDVVRWLFGADPRVLMVLVGVAVVAGDTLLRRRDLAQRSASPHAEAAVPSVASAAHAVAVEAPALPDRPSMAVLPFANISGDPQGDYFAEGMAEEIITSLSHCPALFVIARNSSFTYKGASIDLRQIGRELGVRYVLQGSVRRGGNTLRFAAQLVDAASGTHIWADRFEGELSDVFGLQDRLTAAVVAAIEPSLQRAEIERLKHKPVANLDAYDLLLRAQQLEYEFTRDGMTAALSHLRQAIKLDPNYAPAMALAAYCLVECRNQGWTDNVAADAAEALRLSRRAVELASDNSNVLCMVAYVTRQITVDTQAARDLIYRSLAINPNSAMALTIAGWIEFAVGNAMTAIDQFLRAERLSPRDPKGWFIAGGLSVAYYLSGQYEASVAAARRALRENPRFAIALRMLAASYARLGRAEEGGAAVRELLAIDPRLSVSVWKSGRHAMAFSEEVQNRICEGLRMAGLPE